MTDRSQYLFTTCTGPRMLSTGMKAYSLLGEGLFLQPSFLCGQSLKESNVLSNISSFVI